MSVREDLHKTLNYLRRNGLSDTWIAARERLRARADGEECSDAPASEEELAAQRDAWQRLSRGEAPESVFGPACAGRTAPKISVLCPAYETRKVYLEQLLRSLEAQTYGLWEFILADASESRGVEEAARPFLERDPRIRYVHLPVNGGISRNTNAAAQYATGEYVAFLDHDDFLAPDALFEAAGGILRTDCEILYTDEDKCDESAERFFEPNRKPDFDYDYLLSNNYICHLLVMKRGLFLALPLRERFDGAQDYDLLLRAPKTRICHVPRVLYHWRTHPGSTAGDPGNKSYAAEAGKNALEEYLSSHGIDAEVRHSRHRGFYDVIYRPDIFTARPDVGVTGGKITDWRRRVVGGQLREDGSVEFLGRDERESGPMHRMDTRHDCAAVDVRCMRIRPELRGLYQEIFGSSYDAHVLLPEVDYTAQSLAFCRRAAALGYRIVWDPEMVLRLS